MKTTTNYNIENLSEEQIKSIALLQHLGEDFFVLDDKVFAGSESDALDSYNGENCCQLTTLDLSECETEADQAKIYDWCISELEQVEPYDENDYNYNNDYLVLTDREADEKAAEYIKNSLWAFNADFLASETGFDYVVFEALQPRCEDANNAIETLIEKSCGLDSFIESAISADGRGHFMSSYDGHENEENVNGETFYIYRIN